MPLETCILKNENYWGRKAHETGDLSSVCWSRQQVSPDIRAFPATPELLWFNPLTQNALCALLREGGLTGRGSACCPDEPN